MKALLIHSYFTKYIALCFTFLTSVMLARNLGPDLQGVLAGFIFLSNFIVLYSDLGFYESIVQFFSKDKRLTSIDTVKLVLLMVLVSLTFTMVYIFYKGSGDGSFPVIGFIILVISLFAKMLFLSLLRATLKIKNYNLVILYESVILFSSLSYLIITDSSIYIMIYAYAATYLISALYAAIIIDFKSLQKNKVIQKEQFIKYGLKNYIYKFLNSSEGYADKLIILFFLNTHSFGIYTVAVGLSMILYQAISGPVINFLLPAINKMDANKRNRYVVLAVQVLYVVGGILALLVVLFSKEFVGLVYGPEYLDVSLILNILIIGVLIKTPMSVLGYFFKSIDKVDVLTKISLVTLPLNVVLNLILIYYFSLIGAAIASLISYTLFGLLLVNRFSRETQQSYGNILIFNHNSLKTLRRLLNDH